MKSICLISAFLFSAQALACQCTDYPLSPKPAVKEYLANHYRYQSIVGEMEWIAYYPSLEERIFWSSDRGTSCAGSGPNGEIFAHCARSRKSDYRITMANCEVVIRAKSNFKNVSVRELSSTCEKH